MNGTESAFPKKQYIQGLQDDVQGLTKFEYMVIEFVKSTLPNYSNVNTCIEHSIKTAQQVIKQLNQLENERK